MPPVATSFIRPRWTVRHLAAVIALAAAVVVPGASGALADTPPGATEVWTFENDPVGSVPSGCTTPAGNAPAAVSDQNAYHSTRSLLVSDLTSTAMTGVRCTGATRHGATMTLDVLPADLPNGFTVDFYGDLRGVAGTQSVFHLLIDSSGQIRWYDAGGWTTIAPAGTVTPHEWNHLTLAVPTDNSVVHVWVGGRYVGDGGPRGVRDVSDVTGWGLTSDGTGPAGDVVYVDNVNYGDASLAPSIDRESPLNVSPPVVIDEAATPLQMPNAAVTVPRDGGQRILVSYPAHTDSGATSGNRYAYSDDAGAHWTPAPQSNPMPTAASYNMTLLPNGDVLAVSYHSYLVPNSGDTQANVDTAVSHDGGQTWTSRVGTATAPVPIAPAPASDRPGVTMASLYWVHNVVADADGTVYQSVYGYYAGDRKYRQLVLVSHDEGLTWTVRSTVAYEPSLRGERNYEGTCEGALARAADGSLLIVMRAGSYLPMYVARSTDNGATWSAPELLLAGPNKQPVVSVYPVMSRLSSDGPLVLLVGRPGLSLLVSPDGSGHTWTAPQEADYQNSANGVFTALDSTHLVLFGDRGANWSWPTPSPYQVWSRQVSVELQ